MRSSSPIRARYFLDQTRKDSGRARYWCVDLPAVLSPTGKRKRTFVTSERAARELCATLNTGMHSTDPLTPALPPEHATARLMLEPHGVGIVEAAAFAVEVIRRCGSLGNARHILTRGAGMISENTPSCDAALRAMNSAKTHLATATVHTRDAVFRRLWRDSPDLANMPVTLVTADIVREALLRSWPHAVTCYNNALRQLRALFAWAVKRKFLGVNPALDVDFLHKQETEIQALTPEQVADILRACRPATQSEIGQRAALAAAVRSGTAPEGAAYDLRWLTLDTSPLLPAFALMAFAGVRPTEVTRLAWGDISREDGVVSVRGRKSKTGGTRHITIRPVLRAWLDLFGDHPHDAPVLPPESLKFKLTAVHRRAGFDHGGGTPWQADALRHTFATMALKNGTGLAELEQDMGHTDASMLRARYLNMRGVTAESARRFWSLTPATVLSIC